MAANTAVGGTLPIRPFYCVYLLRSLSNGTSTYVGSTPDPRKRLAQHNGVVKGGAIRTSIKRLRPWEMACIVTGFPSQLAALQFEWAWAHAYKTTKIPKADRPKGNKTTRYSKKTGRKFTRIMKPRTNLTNILKQLNILLQVPSFYRWPLAIRFFVEEIWEKWEKQKKDLLADGGVPIRSTISIQLDQRLQEPEAVEAENEGLKIPTKRKGRRFDQNGAGGLQGLDISDDNIQPCLQKTHELISESNDSDPLICMICKEELQHPHDTTVVCPHAFCEHISHITCLASEFLTQEASKPKGSHSDSRHVAAIYTHVLPVEGECPGCKKSTQWIDIVKPLTYRLRARVPGKKLRVAKAPITTQKAKKTRERRKGVVKIEKEMVDNDGQVTKEEEEEEEEDVREFDWRATNDSEFSDIESWFWKDPFAEYHLPEEYSDMDLEEDESDESAYMN